MITTEKLKRKKCTKGKRVAFFTLGIYRSLSTSSSKRDGFQQNIACIGLVRWISATEKEEIFRNGGGANGKIGHVIFVDITESSIENPLNFH